MSESDAKLVDLGVEVRRETVRAYLIFDGTAETWIPKSMCEVSHEPGQGATLTLPEWLAKSKGLI